MTNRTLTLQQQTRMVVNIMIEDDTGILAWSFSLMTSLFTLLWHVTRFGSAFCFEVTELVKNTSDLITALSMVASIYLSITSIVVKSLAFGMGVRL